MKLFTSTRELSALLLTVILLAGLNGCGSTGGEADTDAPLLTLTPISTSTLERTRLLSGTMEAGAGVAVTANTAASIGPVTVTADTWSCSVDLVPGANTLSVKATDATGNNLTLAFVLTYEVVTLDRVLLNTSSATQTLGGSRAAEASLSATLDGIALTEAPAFTGNDWSWDLTLGEGSHTLVVEGIDGAGQKTTLTQTLVFDPTLPAVSVNPVTAPITDPLQLSGTMSPGAVVSLTPPSGVTVASLDQDSAAGTWSGNLSGLLPDRNQIDINATAPDGKQGTVRLAVFFQPSTN
jgi:hypothetical protein